MKKGFFIALLGILCLTRDASLAYGADAAKTIVALEANSHSAIESGSILATGTREKTFVDKQNMNIVMGPQSVGEFSGQGVFRLLRGSAYIESKSERSFQTTNATVDFIGRVLVSFDHHERSTSVFALAGETRMHNSFEADRTIVVSRHQGATLVTGEVYPNLVRGIDLAETNNWLKGFHWSEERRQEFLRDVPKIDELRTMMAEQTKKIEEQADPEGRVGLKKNPLSDYYSSIYDQGELPKKHEEYKAIDEKPQALVANKTPEAEVVMSPEHAAIIALPDNKINLDFTDVLSQAEQEAEPKAKVLEPVREPVRKIASLPKKVVHKAPVVLSAEEQVIQRLRQVHGQTAERRPASLSTKKAASLVPDPVYDLSENF